MLPITPSGGDVPDDSFRALLRSGALFSEGASVARTTCHSLLNSPSSTYLTIITVHGQCSLTRSLVLPRKNRVIRECPCWPMTTRLKPSLSA